MFDHEGETKDILDSAAKEELAKPQNVSEMFQDDSNQGVMDTMGELAVTIATMAASVKEREDDLKADKGVLDGMKTKLGEMMVANNCKNGHKFDNGCFVKPFVQTKIFKAKGVSDEDLFAFLKANDMADIIKPSVNWQTMNATLKEFMSLNNGSLPTDTFNITNDQTMKFSGNGHIKMLATLGKDGE